MPKRDWEEAREKIEREGGCRVCGSSELLQAAHTVGRSKQDVKEGSRLVVKGDSVVPLCQTHHEEYDRRELDLLAYVGLWEQIDAVEAAGGIEAARKRLTGGAG